MNSWLRLILVLPVVGCSQIDLLCCWRLQTYKNVSRMPKFTKLLLVSDAKVIVMAFFAVACAGCVNDSAAALTMEMKVETSPLASGAVVVSTRVNSSFSSPVRILRWNTPLDTAVTGRFLRVLDVTGKVPVEILYQGIMVKRGEPHPQDYVEINPKSSVENTLDISESYRFCRDRRYVIEMVASFYTSDRVEHKVLGGLVEFTASNSFPSC